MQVYQRYSKLLSADKSGKLTVALDNFIMRHPTQEEKYMLLLHELLPELI